jgi:hypothetical protein
VEIRVVDDPAKSPRVSGVGDGGGGCSKLAAAGRVRSKLVGQGLLCEATDHVRRLDTADSPPGAAPRTVEPGEDITVRHVASLPGRADIVNF